MHKPGLRHEASPANFGARLLGVLHEARAADRLKLKDLESEVDDIVGWLLENREASQLSAEEIATMIFAVSQVRRAAQAPGSVGGGANPRGRRRQHAHKDSAGRRSTSRRRSMMGVGCCGAQKQSMIPVAAETTSLSAPV